LAVSNEAERPSRARHAASRARNITAGVAATAFIGLGGAMALTAHGTTAGASSVHDDSTTAPNVAPAPAPADPWARVYDDDDWGAQPAPPAPDFGSGGANTSTHGS
jgi:hypothetical protein